MKGRNSSLSLIVDRSGWQTKEIAMDYRTSVRELEELIRRTQCTIDREAAAFLVTVHRSAEMRDGLRAMRLRLRELRKLRSAMNKRRELRPKVA